ncbi:AEC family transporter [Cellulosilyticum sp. I15G10I2]|uniref:AEC family transporter n=1 Tax=Cellulosilyticum sp. I15G10I2 TaxID=1892843 RepID=UPI00085BBFC8|nr:hypothetical protein [Cellulosilyticum sp. I15G10I2]
MIRFLIPTGIILVALILGKSIKFLTLKYKIEETVPVSKYIRMIQITALLGINPIITIGAFWGTNLNNIKLAALPVLGFGALVVGGILGYIASKLLKHTKRQTGSMIVSGSFTNIGNFGGLVCYIFFGEVSYALVAMYKLLEEIAYYLIGYPIAKLYGTDPKSGVKRSAFIKLITDPFILIYFVSILIGGSLNISGVPRFAIYQHINEILIPLSSFLLVTSVGFNMRLKAISTYLPECFVVASIKFLMVPAIITSVAYFLGIGSIQDGLVLKVVLVLSAMSPAFNSLIPPQLYDLDVDLANSAWLFCTGLLLVVVPILNVIQGLI